MKWMFIFILVFSCQQQEAVTPATTSNTNTEAAIPATSGTAVKEEDCDDKAKQAQKVEITEETIKLGGSADAGCTLE